ncbi:MAG TPA: hypothetical protein VD769_02635 [Gaiellaceae bacterium]|nr:hypothetical protein [Gaiellaceae bacterium]
MRLAAIAGVAAALLAPTALGAPLPGAPDCPVFPPSSVWNKPIHKLPVQKNSATIVKAIGANLRLHADFGSGLWDGGPIGIPITVVDGSQPKSWVDFHYDEESDPGPYPIPPDIAIEGGPHADGDRHAVIVDRDTCTLYELFDLWPGWSAGSGAIWNLRSNLLRPRGWTSADAAGLPILPGLARYHEVARGEIDHALRFTVRRSRRAYVYPARHFASSSTDRRLPPMGLRLKLRASFPVAGFPRQARIILRALKRYGMIVADNGSSWYISGAPDPRWSNDQLHTLHRVRGSDFRVVNTSKLRP